MIEGSLAALKAEDGALLAMVGGGAFSFSNQLNRAADAFRPIGSAVKPFIYAAAFESGRFKPQDVFVDEPLKYRVGDGRRWSPRNYGNKYYGTVTLSFALHKSLNSVAIQLLRQVGVGAAGRLLCAASGAEASRFPRNLSLALGTADLSALELARAYSVFTAGGKSAEPYFIRYIEDRQGRVIQDQRVRPAPASALKAETCALMVELMKGVLGPEGTAYAAALKAGFNIPAAGKTGTTNDYRDAWFAGVTPDLAAAVWLGHDDMRVPLAFGQAGGSVAAPIWMNFVKGFYRNRPTRDFRF